MEDTPERCDGAPGAAQLPTTVALARPKVHQGRLWENFFNAPPAEPDEEPAQATEIFDRARGDHRYGPDADNHITDERISHLLGRILRYHLETVGIVPDEAGYVSVVELLASCPDFHGTAEDDVRRVVQESRSGRGPRFELREAADGAAGGLAVRATYRHPRERRRFRLPLPAARGMAALPAFADVPGVAAAASGSSGAVAGGNPGGGGSPQHGSSDAVAASGHQEDAVARKWPGFSRPPPQHDAGEDGDELDDEDFCLPARHLRALPPPRTNGVTSNGGTAAAAAPVPANVRGSAAMALGNPGAAAAGGVKAAPSPSEQPAPAAEEEEDTLTLEAGWERYLEPGSRRAWFWNSASDEVFYADDAASGWERFEDAEGRPWWWHQVSGRFFFHDEDDEEEDEVLE